MLNISEKTVEGHLTKALRHLLLCSPIFDKTAICLPNGKTFQIVTHKSGTVSKFIHQVKWNGKPFAKNYITYETMMKGDRLDIYLQAKPDKQWGSKPAMQPAGM